LCTSAGSSKEQINLIATNPSKVNSDIAGNSNVKRIGFGALDMVSFMVNDR
jgi:hypothetical protein